MKSIRDALTISDALASEQKIVARLMQLYQHDFSEFAQGDPSWGDVGEDGLFSYIHLDDYWTQERRKPFLFRVDGKLAGFAFISGRSHSGRAVDWCISEFFVMRKYRRCGLGAHAARRIIRSHPGVWEIPILFCNLPAQAFWPNAVACLVGYDVEELSGDGERWSGPILRLVPKQDSRKRQTS